MTVAKSEARLVAEAESAAREASRRLDEISASLLEANQALAQIPLLEFRVEELLRENVWLVEERARLEARIASLQARVDDIEGPPS